MEIDREAAETKAIGGDGGRSQKRAGKAAEPCIRATTPGALKQTAPFAATSQLCCDNVHLQKCINAVMRGQINKKKVVEKNLS